MDIKKRLTFQFITIVALILLISSLSIYFFSADYRQNDFYNRLKNKAINVAKLLIDVEEIDAALLRKMEIDNPLSLPDEKIIIYNYENEILYSTDDEELLQFDEELLNEIRLKGEVQFRHGDYDVLGFLYTGKYDRFVVIASAIDIYGLRKLKNLRTILLIVFGASVCVVFFSGWIFSGKALLPINKVINKVNEISATKLSIRLEEGSENDEIGKLANTFNKMLDRLEIAFQLQKNFIANASHELRTPLTAIKGQIEVILLKDRSTDEYKEVIASILEDINNLNKLTNGLLLLAQTSASSIQTNKKSIRVDDILWQTRSDILKQCPNYSINIEFDSSIDDERKLLISGNESLLKIAISNLIDNGCKYSEKHLVNIEIRYHSGQLALIFIDSGIGIAKEDQKQIFEPFYRGKNAFSQKGYGIGLSLVKRIVLLHSGNIILNSEPNKGTKITISLPGNF